ncbi:MAG TPA: glycosyltransferase family 4 protein [Planctomycetes bacterium]|nr:glycosyltransferase family 4 protein [Planctomycetota bacterium]HIJ71231.1 glycosyltransferase family 4 protein [Planctomycetota bacterium]
MNILMVLSTKVFPPDGRVEREARSLIGDGHNVFLMARRGPGQQVREIVEGVQVIRVPLPMQRKKAIADFIYFFVQRYFILFHILRACRKNRIDALHVHDLCYALATTLAGKLLRLPVVFDMHEHYTAMLRMSFEAKVYRKFKPFAFILLSLLRVEEKFACRRAQKVIVVADEHIGRIEGLGVARDNIVVVTNTEDTDYFRAFPIDESLLHKWDQDFVILYVGGFSPHRGLETAIGAMPAVLEKIPNARLLLVGDGVIRGELEQLVYRLALAEKVTFTGHQHFRMIPTYIHLSSVCLIPHISTPHIETTMPNKIFQFMMLGKPVVVSNTRPMMRIVKDAECGLIFKERNAQSLAETIIQLADDNLRRQLGENGQRAVDDRYNWKKTVQALLDLYR